MTDEEIKHTIDFLYKRRKMCVFCSFKPICLIHFDNPTTKLFANAYGVCNKHLHITLKFSDLVKVAHANKNN